EHGVQFGRDARAVQPLERLLVAGIAQAERQVQAVVGGPDDVGEHGGRVEIALVNHVLLPTVAEGAGGNSSHAQDHVGQREQRLSGGIGQDGVDAVGCGVGVAALFGVFAVVAGAGDPVERAVFAGETEFLVPGPVLFAVVG